MISRHKMPVVDELAYRTRKMTNVPLTEEVEEDSDAGSSAAESPSSEDVVIGNSVVGDSVVEAVVAATKFASIMAATSSA